MRAHAQVHHAQLLERVVLHRDPLQHRRTLPVLQLRGHRGKQFRRLREREVLLGDAERDIALELELAAEQLIRGADNELREATQELETLRGVLAGTGTN